MIEDSGAAAVDEVHATADFAVVKIGDIAVPRTECVLPSLDGEIFKNLAFAIAEQRLLWADLAGGVFHGEVFRAEIIGAGFQHGNFVGAAGDDDIGAGFAGAAERDETFSTRDGDAFGVSAGG